MLCPKCNTAIYEGEKFCPNCGTAVSANQPAPVTAANPVCVPPVQNNIPKEFTEDDLPEQYRPLNPWTYFGLSMLFTVPLVGFVFLIVFSFNGSNINRRNFARSYWCALIIVGTVLVVGLFLSLLFLKSVPDNVRYY